MSKKDAELRFKRIDETLYKKYKDYLKEENRITKEIEQLVVKQRVASRDASRTKLEALSKIAAICFEHEEEILSKLASMGYKALDTRYVQRLSGDEYGLNLIHEDYTYNFDMYPSANYLRENTAIDRYSEVTIEIEKIIEKYL